MKPIKLFLITGVFLCLVKSASAQQKMNAAKSLDAKQESLIAISALAGKGALKPLHTAMNEGLNAGWTINELKEAMVHLYAYQIHK